jgi:prepilin-type N-terminal cleavage/methylation domain-containing protein
MTPRRLTMKNKGFTLIELLLVMAILNIITTIALPALVSAKRGHKPVSTPSNVYEVSTTPKPIANVVGLTEDAAFTKVGYPDSKSDLGQGRIKYTYAPGSQIRSLVAKDGKVISVER